MIRPGCGVPLPPGAHEDRDGRTVYVCALGHEHSFMAIAIACDLESDALAEAFPVHR